MVPQSGCPSICCSFGAKLFNQSLSCGIVPQQWKKACITPIPKVAHPAGPGDYRPISITPVLSRMLERHIVKVHIYPALQQPPPTGFNFADQFAFMPTILQTQRLSLYSTLLVRERSALSDLYCHSTWNSASVFVCPQLSGQISRKPKELAGKLLWRAHRNVVRGYRMVTSPMTSRDPMTSYP